MTVHNSDSTQPACHQADSPVSAAPTAPQTPTFKSGVAQPASQAERSVMHPEWQDPEWRYYHGAWGG